MTQLDGRRHLIRALAVTAATTTTATLVAGAGVAQAATTPPSVSFVAATKNVTATRYVDGHYHWLDFDLGINVIAGQSPLEIRAKRKSYADPIVAEQYLVHNGRTTKVKLPAGLVKNFGGLSKFTTITIKNAAGATVKNYQTDFCPNSYDSTRTRRDAPAQSPYPTSCAAENPFTLGGVWGIQAGWNASVADQPPRSPGKPGDFDLPVGKYTATVSMSPAYQKLFRVSAQASTVKLNLTVVPGDSRGGGAARIREEAATAVRPGVPGAVALQAAAARPAVSAAAPKSGPRPDLRALPAWGISLERGTNDTTGAPNGKWYINFGATVWNAGTSRLLVDGFRRPGTDVMDAYQYFFDASGKQVGSVSAGTMEWDAREGHQHWHFRDFARYDLLRSDQKLAVRSGKEAFCLANTDAVDYTLPNASWRPSNTDLSTACGGHTAVAVREVLDIGNGDTYSQDRPGQSFEVTNLPNGTYYIRVQANPANRLKELSTSNNTSLRKVILGGTATKRTLTVPPVNGISG